MADEIVTPTEDVAETTPDEGVTTPNGGISEVEDVSEPHPLEPGGRRFSEVYGEMKEARREAQELRERMARMEGTLAAQQPKPAPTPAPAYYTAAQLQAAVDTGKISPAQMSDQLAWQRSREVETNIEQRFEAKRRNETALSEINEYVKKIPNLRNTSSDEFQRVKEIAQEIAEDIGKSVDDLFVQKRALREAFGNLKKLTQVRDAVNAPRGLNNMDGETRGNGGVTGSSVKGDALKDVPQMYKDHWKKLGYTREQMESEAKFIQPRRSR